MGARKKQTTAPASSRARTPWTKYAPTPLTGKLAPLWHAVLSRPSDLGARAVLADALSEAGDARGEYLQLALSTKLDADALERRDELFDRLSPEWRRPLMVTDRALSPNLRSFDFAHGLVERASLQLRTPKVLDWLAERAPIRELELSEYEADPRWVSWFVVHPLTAHLRRLDVGFEQGDRALAFFSAPRWAELEELVLDAPVTRQLIDLVVAHAPKLRHLRLLARDGALTAADVKRLGELPLERLQLLNLELDDAAVSALSRLGSLRSLSLGRAAVAVKALAKLKHLEALELDAVAPEGDLLVVALSAMPKLRSLTLQNELISAAQLTKALKCAPKLTHLALESGEVGDAVTKALEPLTALTSLRLSQLGTTPAALATLSSLEAPLVELDLSLAPCTDPAARALATGPLLRGLKALSLRMVNVGSGGAKALSAAPWLPSLERLSLFSNRIGNVGLRAMLDHLPNVRVLHLGSENAWREEGVLSATRGVVPKLRELRVEQISSPTLVRFIESGFADDLRSLSLTRCEVDLAAAQALVTLPRLRVLNAPWSSLQAKESAVLDTRWPDIGR